MAYKFPKIEVEAKVKGKRSRKKLDSTLNTSVFAHFIDDALKASDDKKVSVKIVEEKKIGGRRSKASKTL